MRIFIIIFIAMVIGWGGGAIVFCKYNFMVSVVIVPEKITTSNTFVEYS